MSLKFTVDFIVCDYESYFGVMPEKIIYMCPVTTIIVSFLTNGQKFVDLPVVLVGKKS